MIRFHLKQLIADKEFLERRRIMIMEVAEAVDLSRSTLSKMINYRGATVSSDALDRLCNYFECPIEALATHVPDHVPALPRKKKVQK